MTELLLTFLGKHVNARGLVLVREATLVDALQVPPLEVRASLRELRASGAIEILSGPPFFVVALRNSSWAGSDNAAAPSLAKGAHNSQPAYSHSYSSRTKNGHSYPERERLLNEILETVGETDPSSFEGALENYSRETIRTALERVRRMKQVRRSRTALFRYLLPRIAREHRSTT